MRSIRFSRLVMKTSSTAILAIAVGASISGCVTRYVEPTGTSIASIDFIDEASNLISVHLHGGAAECTDRATAGLVQGKSQRKIAVTAGQSVVFTVGMDIGGTSPLMAFGALGGALASATYKGCTPTIDFIPEAGRSYVFRINSDGKDCTYQFFSKSPAGEAQPVAFSQREWIRATTESGPFCKRK